VRLTSEPLDLPGVRRFWRRVETAVGDGVSVVLVCPNRDASDVLEGLASGRRRFGWSVTFTELDGLALNPTERILELHGVLTPVGSRLDVRSVSQLAELSGRVLWVDGMGSGAEAVRVWLTYLARFVEGVKAVPPASRMVIVTALAGAAAPTTLSSAPLTRVMWWWGLLGPLDVATFIEQECKDNPNGEAAACAAAVARFDLELAEMLLEQPGFWYGDPTRLRALLQSYAREQGFPTTGLPNMSGDASSPSPCLRSAWSEGRLEWWHGRVEPHSAVVSQDDPSAHYGGLLWEGQIRSLLPELEIRRKRLGVWVQTRELIIDHYDLLAELHDGDDAVPLAELEIGPLAFLVGRLADNAQTTRQQASYAHTLRLARNDLAHFRPVPAIRLSQLKQLSAVEDAILASGPHQHRSYAPTVSGRSSKPTNSQLSSQECPVSAVTT
jgi:hypothetical protein